MGLRNEEVIDLQKLTQRELLIKVTYQLESLKKDLSNNIISIDKRIQTIENRQYLAKIEFTKLDTKIKTQAGFWGAVSGLIIGLITILIKIFAK